jgi:hypothetical protein
MLECIQRMAHGARGIGRTSLACCGNLHAEGKGSEQRHTSMARSRWSWCSTHTFQEPLRSKALASCRAAHTSSAICAVR